MTPEHAEKSFNRTFLAAWLTWALSLFLPAVAMRGFAVGDLKGDIVFPGWQVAAICMLHPAGAGEGALGLLIRLMALTNLVMAASLTTLVTRRRAVKRAFMYLAVGAACLDALAVVWYLSMLSYGYVAWLASFVMLALALSRDRRPTSPF